MTDRKDFESEDSAILEDIRDDDREARAEQQIEIADLAAKGQRVRTTLKARLGEDVYSSWFASLEFQSFDGKTLRASVPVKFLKTWIQTHYSDALLTCCAQEFKGVEKVEITQRQPGGATGRPITSGAVHPAVSEHAGSSHSGAGDTRRVPVGRMASHMQTSGSRLQVNGLEGSPLDPRYTFDSFMVGPSNRMAHAGATQVADTVFADERGFNPLYIHSPVGHGKTHLLHAIAWEVSRRAPHAKVLYLTAERFRFQFVEALKAQDAMAFKDRFRSIDMLLIDDLEFMQGEKTELEFDHIINSLLDSGRQLVVASARAPGQLVRLNDRMRSRLQRGLVTEMGSLDFDLRLKILERRVQEKRAADASFEIPREVDRAPRRAAYGERPRARRRGDPALCHLAVHAHADHARHRRDGDPRPRARHRAAADQDRGHPAHHLAPLSACRRATSFRNAATARWFGRARSACTWPSSSRRARLPEIGRRFGNRDHTTVLHAIRKIEGEIERQHAPQGRDRGPEEATEQLRR